MITIVNYGSGNIAAIANIYKRLGIAYSIADTPNKLEGAEKLVLPGVGAFDQTMKLLIESGLRDKLDQLVLIDKVPIIGICVGMQILGNGSDEGEQKGLGWIEGKVKKIDTSNFTQKPFVPHMGWNSIKSSMNNPIFNGIDQDFGFYFLHTYYFECDITDNILSTTQYGKRYASSIHRDNVYGVQFHPEKSHSNGIRLLQNFANL